MLRWSQRWGSHALAVKFDLVNMNLDTHAQVLRGALETSRLSDHAQIALMTLRPFRQDEMVDTCERPPSAMRECIVRQSSITKVCGCDLLCKA